MDQCEICTGVENVNRTLCEECTEMVQELAGHYRVMTQKVNTEKVVEELQKRRSS